MKTALFITLLAVLLTACAAPTPAATATVTPLPSNSPAPSATATVTNTPIPTSTPAMLPGYLSSLNFKETVAVDNFEYMGAPVSVTFNIDSSATNIHNITMPDELAARIGTLALEALFAPEQSQDDAGLKAFNEQRKNGILTITIDTFDANKRTQKPEKMTLALAGEGMEVPVDTMQVKRVNFVYGYWYENPEQGIFTVSEDTPWFTLSHKQRDGIGFGILVDKNSSDLYVFVGFNYLVKDSQTLARTLGGYTYTSFEWLRLIALGKFNTVSASVAGRKFGEWMIGSGLQIE